MGVFAYSQEEGTPAGDMENQVSEEVKRERAESIMRHQVDVSRAVNEKKVGRTIDVLVEAVDEEGEETVTYTGRSEYDAPEIDGSVIFRDLCPEVKLKPGDFVKVRIDDAFDYDLVGTLIR